MFLAKRFSPETSSVTSLGAIVDFCIEGKHHPRLVLSIGLGDGKGCGENSRIFLREADARKKTPAFLSFDHEKEQAHAPAEIPSAFQFTRESRIHRRGHQKSLARLKKDFEKWGGIEFMDHFPIEMHRAAEAILVGA